eukprot:882662-Rhodomonas_salina.4
MAAHRFCQASIVALRLSRLRAGPRVVAPLVGFWSVPNVLHQILNRFLALVDARLLCHNPLDAVRGITFLSIECWRRRRWTCYTEGWVPSSLLPQSTHRQGRVESFRTVGQVCRHRVARRLACRNRELAKALGRELRRIHQIEVLGAQPSLIPPTSKAT